MLSSQAVPLVQVVHDGPEQQHLRGKVTIFSSKWSLRIDVMVTNRGAVVAAIPAGPWPI